MTDSEATLWLNGSEISVDSEGRANLELILQPTIWGQSTQGQQGQSNMWDTSTWSWHGMNEFNLTAVRSGRELEPCKPEHGVRSLGASNEGPTPQLSFDSMRLLEWGDAHVPVEPNPYSINLGEVICQPSV